MSALASSTPVASTSARVVEDDWCIPASRSPSPDHERNLEHVRARCQLADAPRLREGRITRKANEKHFPSLISAKFKGAFELSPWRVREREEYKNEQGRLPYDMEEWEEWEATKKVKENQNEATGKADGVEKVELGAAFTQDERKGKRREKRKSSTIVDLAAAVPGASLPRRSATLTSLFSSTKPSTKSAVKPRSSYGSSGQPFVDIVSPRPRTSTPSPSRSKNRPQPKGTVSPKRSLNAIDPTGVKSPFATSGKWSPGQILPRRSLGLNESILFEAGCSQMIIKSATQGQPTPAPKFPSLSFPAGLPTSTPFHKSATPQLRTGSEDSMLAAPADTSTSPILVNDPKAVEQPRGSNGSITVEHFGLTGSGEAAGPSKRVEQVIQESISKTGGGEGMLLSKLGGTSTNSSANLFAEEAEITEFLNEEDFC